MHTGILFPGKYPGNKIPVSVVSGFWRILYAYHPL